MSEVHAQATRPECVQPDAPFAHRVAVDAARHLGTAPQDDKPGAQKSGCAPASWRWPCACLVGLALYPETDLERLQVKVRFGQQLLEPGILDLKILQAPSLISFHSTVLGAPPVERGLAEPALAANSRPFGRCGVLAEGRSALATIRGCSMTKLSQLADVLPKESTQTPEGSDVAPAQGIQILARLSDDVGD